MGLSTTIVIETQPRPGDVRALFDHCRRLLGAEGRHRWHEGPSAYMPGDLEYAMHPCQGLSVWLKIFHTDTGGHLQGHDPEDDIPAGTVAIQLDDGPAKEHDRLIAAVGSWLRTRGWKWQWRQEHPDTPWRRG